jgi:uncharacterized membrane-anchored protein YjiN (DUF445 family)
VDHDYGLGAGALDVDGHGGNVSASKVADFRARRYNYRHAASAAERVSMSTTEKDHDLRRMRFWATALLGAAALLYLLSHRYQAAHPVFPYLAALGEAAVIGALADWFAVVALFRHPLGMRFLPHTAVLPKNKARIARGIAEFIQQNFLSAPSIVQKIAEFGPADKLRQWLLRPDNAHWIAVRLTRLARFALEALDDERVQRFLQAAVSERLRRADLSGLAAQLLQVLTANGRHHVLLDEALRLFEQALAEPEARATLARAVVAESALVAMAKRLGFDLDDTIALKIVNGAARVIGEIRADAQHPLRQRFDQFAAGFIERLKSEPETRRKVEALRDELLANPALIGTVGALWREFRDWLGRDLDQPDSRVQSAIAQLAASVGRQLDTDPGIRGWIDDQILKAIPPLVEENRAAIGRFIEDRINEWHEERFVAEIEREIGRDLQFIRINGTIVGGLAGLAIHSLTQIAR